MIGVTCDECGKALRVKDEAAGKKVKCSGCGSILSVPRAAPAAAAPAAAEEARVKPAKSPSVPPPEERIRPAPRPPGRAAKGDAGEDDDSPRRLSRRNADEDDDRPRRAKAPPKKPSAAAKVLSIVASLVTLAGSALVIWLVFLRGISVPPLKEFESKPGAFKILLPGEPKETTTTTNSPEGPITHRTYTSSYPDAGQEFIVTFFDYPPRMTGEGAATRVEAEVDKIASDVKNPKTKGRKGAWDVGPGMVAAQITVESSDQGTTRARAIMVKQRCFVIGMRTPSEDRFEDLSKQIYDSFKIVGEVPDLTKEEPPKDKTKEPKEEKPKEEPKEKKDPGAHTGDIEGIALSPKGDKLATVARDGTLRIWDFPTGKHLVMADLKDDFRTPNSVAFAPDGDLLAVGLGGPGEKLIFWDLPTRTEKKRLDVGGSADFLKFSDDGKWLMFAGRSLVFRFNVAAPVKAEEVGQASSAVMGRGNVVVGGWTKEFKLLDLEKGKLTPPSTWPRPGDRTRALAVSGDGQIIAVATSKEVSFIDVAKLSLIEDRSVSISDTDQIALSANGDFLAVRGRDACFVYSASDGKLIQRIEGGVSRLIFAPDDRLVLVRGATFEIREALKKE
jgi:WD40 repeat protein